MNVRTVTEPAKAIIVRKYCECGGEFHVIQGFALATYPPQYTHRCNKCGATINFYQTYPSFEVRSLDWEGDDDNNNN